MKHPILNLTKALFPMQSVLKYVRTRESSVVEHFAHNVTIQRPYSQQFIFFVTYDYTK
jgi:hypothetical protein